MNYYSEIEQSFDVSYRHVIEALSELSIEKGVNLDLGCNLSMRSLKVEKIIEFPLENIGISSDQEWVNILNSMDLEVYFYGFSDREKGAALLKKISENKKISSITMLDINEKYSTSMLEFAYETAKKYNIPLIVSAPNATNKEFILKLLDGNFNKQELKSIPQLQTCFCLDGLSNLMEDYNFEEILKKDVFLDETSLKLTSESLFLQEGTLISQYVSYIKDLVDKNSSVSEFIRVYLPQVISRNKVIERIEEKPFLSIVSRTQGKRKEELTEMLLCLTGQTNTNFELLILGHNLGEKEQSDVEQIIDDLPEWIRKKTRLIRVDRGTRTTPLNVGFSNATGEYIVILDDDDLVFDNWVEEFYLAAQKKPGTVLHAYVISQGWESSLEPTEKSLRSTSSPSSMYCKNFDYLDQMCDNHCPVIGVAFPAYSFQKLGIKFDEILTTTEDWDFLMRTVLICGVTDIEKPTSIYRRWKNAENSESLHDLEEWVHNKKIVGEKLNNMPLVLPRGYAKIIEQRFSRQDRSKKGLLELDLDKDAQLFLDIGDGFSEECKVYSETNLYEEQTLNYTNLDRFGAINALRFDPTELAMITVDQLKIEISNGIGELETYYLDNVHTNGFRKDECLLFFKPDPQIILFFPEKKIITEVKITCSIYSEISDERIDEIIYSKKLSDIPLYKRFQGIKGRLRF